MAPGVGIVHRRRVSEAAEEQRKKSNGINWWRGGMREFFRPALAGSCLDYSSSGRPADWLLMLNLGDAGQRAKKQALGMTKSANLCTTRCVDHVAFSFSSLAVAVSISSSINSLVEPRQLPCMIMFVGKNTINESSNQA